MNVRLTPEEIDEIESIAATYGLSAALDHLGLDGLGNYVNTLHQIANTTRDAIKNKRFADINTQAMKEKLDAIEDRRSLTALRQLTGMKTQPEDADEASLVQDLTERS